MDTMYEPVIGLEVHVQLATKSKVFCGCSTEFGLGPNASTCPVCLGLPGSLPVLNKKAFELSLKVAVALNCEMQSYVKFDRKNYYYPDLPKNYQISQFDKPIAFNGALELMNDRTKKVLIKRVHLEEDAGKLLHDQDNRSSVVDYNRAGSALLEIVTEPVIHSPEEAYDYLNTLKATLLYLEVSDCNMEEGSLRCDANISVRKKGELKLGVKAELKNMNSFKAVRDGLGYEIARQIKSLNEGKPIVQETRLWDTDHEVTRTMRTKEEAHDYRYFPEPDLVPFHVMPEYVEKIKASIPELPLARRTRFITDMGLNEKEAGLIIADKKLADYFEAVVALKCEPKLVYNWISTEVLAYLNQKNLKATEFGLKPDALCELINLILDGTISNKMAKEILIEAADTCVRPGDIVNKKGLRQISDSTELKAIIMKVITENERSVNDYKSGKKNALMFLVGQVMKLTKGKANPEMVNKLLTENMS